VKVRFTPEALTEFRDVLEYIEGHSRQGAINVNARIQRVLSNLAGHPFAGTLTSLAGMRRMAVTPYPYLIFYMIEDQEIIVVGIRHSARDPATMPDAP
jgi:toxin ParE1/3/4